MFIKIPLDGDVHGLVGRTFEHGVELVDGLGWYTVPGLAHLPIRRLRPLARLMARPWAANSFTTRPAEIRQHQIRVIGAVSAHRDADHKVLYHFKY